MTNGSRSLLFSLLLILCTGILAEPADVLAETPQANEPMPKSVEPKFTRLVRDENDKLLSMDTAISRYVRADGKNPELVVELVGAVHVGEKSYYEALNSQFTQYDALLFELVAPPETKIPKGGGNRSGNPVSAVQTGLKSLLGLEFQLEQIDYTRENFVHADMSPDEFSKKMKEKNETFWTIFMRMMTQSMAQQANNPDGSADLSLLLALVSKNREIKLKQAMAEQMDQMEGAIQALEGPDGSTILTERNKKALEVLRREMDSGKKNIGIFYGAAHLPDMHRRLQNEFGLKLVELRWIPAWDLKVPPRSRKKKQEQPPEKEDAR